MTSPADTARPRRSVLYMPGDKAKVLEKGKTLAADTLIFDLEDAVAPDNKAIAREAAKAAVEAGGYGPREIIIRINGLDTEWGAEDLNTAVAANPDGILAPKVETAKDIHTLNDTLSAASAPESLKLWVMIEMPLAILNIQEIAATASDTRLFGFVMGTNDLAKEYRAIATPDRLAFQTAFGMTLAAARAFGIVAIDGVYNDIQNTDGLIAECAQGRTLGFDGKTLIHPSQLDAANTAFAPAAEDVAQAEAVIDAFKLPENSGKGVIKVNGKMTELLHLEEAQRVVAMSEAITQMASG